MPSSPASGIIFLVVLSLMHRHHVAHGVSHAFEKRIRDVAVKPRPEIGLVPEDLLGLWSQLLEHLLLRVFVSLAGHLLDHVIYLLVG